MKVIVESWGFSLLFTSREDLAAHVENLQGELAWADNNNLSYPKTYCVFEEVAKKPEEVQVYLKDLNKRFEKKDWEQEEKIVHRLKDEE